MTKTQYRRARRLIRDNGRTAYAWIAKTYGWVLADKLRDLNDAQDWLKEREDIVAYRRSGESAAHRATPAPSVSTKVVVGWGCSHEHETHTGPPARHQRRRVL